MKKIGIVGCGIRGLLFARALRSVPGVVVAGMSDSSAKAREAAGHECEGEVVASHEQLFSLGLDAAIIATPDFAHREAAVAAASAGLTLMVEKPLATTVEDARAIYDAVETAKVQCLVAFENRWNPSCLKIERLLSQGALGKVISITGVLSNSYYVPLHMLSWASSSSPSWFLMPHIVDLALWYGGAGPVSVCAKGVRGELEARGVDTWDTVHALVGMGNGALANLQSSWVLPDSRPGVVDFRFEVVGSKGAAAIDGNSQGLQMAVDKWSLPSLLPAEVEGEEEGMAAWMVRSFARRLLSGEPLAPGAGHGLLVTQVIDAVHRSLSSGREVLLPDGSR